MPGLVRGIARTAAIAGTATAVSNRVSRRQATRWAGQSQPEPQYQEPQPQPQYQEPAPAAPAPVAEASSADRMAALKDLGELHASGVLTDAEFAAEKARILAS
jgi:hypothetical protein